MLPHTAKIADDLCFVRSVHTEQINHDPAVTFAQTGFQLAGRPSLGAWVSYGLGYVNQDLPAFVVMITGNGQSLAERQWGTGFIPSKYQGVKLRSVGDPVLYVSNPEGFEASQRARFIEDLERLNQFQYEATENPEIATRIAQYEMAFRMQTSVPELTDLSKERSTLRAVRSRFAKARDVRGELSAGAAPGRARRAVHPALSPRVGSSLRAAEGDPATCQQVDQPSAGLIQDLKERACWTTHWSSGPVNSDEPYPRAS